jgi:hypothetical protein
MAHFIIVLAPNGNQKVIDLQDVPLLIEYQVENKKRCEPGTYPNVLKH